MPPSPTSDTSQPQPHSPTTVLAPWRSPLSRALQRNRSQAFARYLQLATVRPDGTPANRTIVFRGFRKDTNQLMFICDRRSEKTDHIRHSPHAEACWYFTKTREQFRLTGELTLITDDTQPASLCQARQQIWQNISANAKIQFAWPHPKAPRTADEAAFSPPPPDENTPPPTFCLLLLTVHSVDHLALRGEPQNRHLYKQISQPIHSTPETSKTNCAADEVPAAQWEVVLVNP